MAWTTAKTTVTADGLMFEFHGDKTDPQGRPLQVAITAVPLVDPGPAPTKTPPDAATLATLTQKALAQVSASVGDGTVPVPQPSLFARLFRRAG